MIQRGLFQHFGSDIGDSKQQYDSQSSGGQQSCQGSLGLSECRIGWDHETYIDDPERNGGCSVIFLSGQERERDEQARNRPFKECPEILPHFAVPSCPVYGSGTDQDKERFSKFGWLDRDGSDPDPGVASSCGGESEWSDHGNREHGKNQALILRKAAQSDRFIAEKHGDVRKNQKNDLLDQ